MLWFASSLIGLASSSEYLTGNYIRSPKNPLDMYPFEHLGICISDPVPEFPHQTELKCNKPLANIQSNQIITPRPWCTSEITNKTRSLLVFLLSKHYELLFSFGGGKSSCPLGEINNSIYTHFNFVFLNLSREFSLHKILPSNPVNISSESISFTYETSFVSTPRVPQKTPIILHFMIGCFVITVMFLVMVLFPNWFSRSGHTIISRIPRHAISLVILCGSGAGVIASVLAALLIGTAVRAWGWVDLVIIESASALASSVVTSILCRIWGVKDVGSAIYFAPLLFPSVILSLLFSAQWISVSVESCMSISLRTIVYYSVTVVFVKIPVNLVGSLLCGVLLKPNQEEPLSKRVSVVTFKSTRHRKTFLTYANSCLFIMAFPIAHHLVQSIRVVFLKIEKDVIILYAIVWVTSVVAIGINSVAVKFEKDSDWGGFAFLATSGAVGVLWLIMYMWSVVVDGMSSTVQMTFYPIITAAVCIGLALASGSLGVMSAVMWIQLKGRVPRRKSKR